MKIKTKNQYKVVLREIDVLLELSFLDHLQTQKLKDLLDALDDYQSHLFEGKLEATGQLASEYSIRGVFKLN